MISAFYSMGLLEANMKLKSSAFKDNEEIPRKYSREGQNLSPPLEIEGIPEETKSLMLILEDPDAPNGTFIHWILWNIPPGVAALPEGVGSTSSSTILGGARQGKNSFENTGYDGPSPPSGEHRYHFQLYALNQEASLRARLNSRELEDVMGENILAHATLTGRYRAAQVRPSA
jgi:Raf kinase inhibitor-like YbhB/YbcL family protein